MSDREIERMIRDGWPTKRIQREARCSVARVVWVRKQIGLSQSALSARNAERDAAIVEMLKAGAKLPEVVNRYRLTATRIRQIAHGAGLDLSTASERRSTAQQAKAAQERALQEMSVSAADAYLERAVALETAPTWMRNEVRRALR